MGGPMLRYAIRQLRKSPGFASAAILTLGVGIGATTAMFSLVNAVLLRPLPFPEPDRITWIQYEDAAAGNGSDTFSYPNFLDLSARQHTFSVLASYRDSGNTLIGAGEARQLVTEIVSADFFRVLRVTPAMGRDFSAADEKKDVRTVMLSWELWQRVFGGRNAVVGGAIDLDGNQYEVAGVMPQGFSYPIRSTPRDLWISRAEDVGGEGALQDQRGAGILNVMGRLKPGATLREVDADLEVIASNLAAEYPKDNRQLTRMVAMPALEHIVEDSRPALRILFGAVAAVLLIGCVNVAGLLLARAARRKPEIAVLAALGAGRGVILRQVLLESVMLSLAGGALGILLSSWTLEALRKLLPATLPRLDHVSIDGNVLVFALVVSIATGILFGAVPAWRMSRVEPLAALRDGGRSATGRQHRLQGALVIAETALSLVLLVGSGLLIRSFLRVLAVNPGFDARNVLTLDMSVPEARYPNAARMRLYKDLLPRLAALPGVQSVSAAWPLPLSGIHVNIGFEIEGRPTEPGAEPFERMGVATPDFFRTMRIPLLAGREFTASDDAKSAGVTIVNEAFARRYFPGQSALGKRIEPGISDGDFKKAVREIVGVVGSIKREGLTAEMDPEYYLAWSQAMITWPTIAIRAASNPSNLIGGVRAAVAELDRGIPVYRAATLENIVSKAAAEPRFQTILFGAFAAMALLLSAIGLYAVLFVHGGATVGRNRSADGVGGAARRCSGSDFK